MPLEHSTHSLRLHLMEATSTRDEAAELVRLFQDFAPPAYEHSSFFPTVRLAALGYARLGFVEQAIALSDVVLEPRGTVVDPELTTAMVQVLQDVEESHGLPVEVQGLRRELFLVLVTIALTEVLGHENRLLFERRP